MKKKLILSSFLALSLWGNAQTSKVRILFDASKAQTAGSADWVIDADVNNLSWTTSGTVTTGGKCGNAQQLPTPAQSTITKTTAETYWTGALSTWGIDCVNYGYQVESLPYNGKITYGDKTNAQDLSNYNVYIVDEPNILYTAAEKTAIINYVANGGGLFILSDHAGSDRNNDGSDSPKIWDDLFTNNGIVSNPFGINFSDANPNGKTYPSDITETAKAVTTNNPISKGVYGTVTEIRYDRGSTMTLDTVANKTVKAVVYANESTSSISGVMVAYATYGKGKIVAIGDSSPSDDGTGYTSNGSSLYVSFRNDPTVANNHENLFMNGTIWLATASAPLPITVDNFFVERTGSLATINWDIANEAGVANYTIEKSFDGVAFNTVTSLRANAAKTYAYCDKIGQNSTIYYRLKMTSQDGEITYSKIVELKQNVTNKLILFPNPSIGNSIKVLTPNLVNNAMLFVYDAKGAKVGTYSISKNSTSFTLPVGNLKKGSYTCSLQQNGQEAATSTFVKP